MTPTRMILSLMVATGLVSGLTACAQTPDSMATADLSMPPAEIQPVLASASSGETAILQATEPSAAIQAYAQAQPAGGVAAEAAYVLRMVQFGLPEMAEAQARDLISRNGDNGLAWAVTAYMSGKRGDMPAALSQVAVAARTLPSDPFVQRTAGQLLAWYDTQKDKSQLPDQARQSVQDTRNALGGQAQFTSAYDDAMAAARQPPATQPVSSAIPAAPPGTSAASISLPESNYAPDSSQLTVPANSYPNYDYSSAYATYPYYPSYANYGAYQPWWPSYYTAGSAFWWPTWGSVFAYPRFDFEHHHRDFDHDHDAFDHDHRDFRFDGKHRSALNNRIFTDQQAAHSRSPGERRPGATAGKSIAGLRLATPGLWHAYAGSTARSSFPAWRAPLGASPAPRLAAPSFNSWSNHRPSFAAPTASRYYGAPRAFVTPRSFSSPHPLAAPRAFSAPMHSFAPTAGRSLGQGFHAGSAAYHERR